jgi:hypothetical protein
MKDLKEANATTDIDLEISKNKILNERHKDEKDKDKINKLFSEWDLKLKQNESNGKFSKEDERTRKLFERPKSEY